MSHADRVDLNSLRIFAAVAETGGFTAAADRLGFAKAKASVAIARLEKQLGANLFSRTTRRVALTEAGAALLDECEPHLRGIESALSAISNPSDELTGTLRISCTADHVIQSLAELVARFAERHPRLQVDLRSSDRVVDLVEQGIDVAIRAGWLSDSTLRAVKLGAFEQWVVASPDYLARHGTPARPEALARTDWLALSLLAAPLTWTFTSADNQRVAVRMKSRLRVDSPASLRALLESGAGISALDQLGAEPAVRAGRLVRVLADWSLPEGGIYAVYPPGRHLPAAARAFIEFYRESLHG